MNYIKDIFTEYKTANAQQRMEFFLLCRDLRSDFDQIETEEISSNIDHSQQIVIEPQKMDTHESLFVRMKRCCFSIFI